MNTRIQWTERQKRVIESRGKNLIVSAGAGSGKTAVMIERICSLLKDGADLRRMVVCTFTKTAAADMKRKLAERLAETDDAHLRKQLSKLSGAEISTLHAWCAHMIKSWFFDGDLDPEFSLLEEGEETALKNEAAEEVIAWEKENGDESFAGLYAVFLSGRTHRRLKEAVLSVYDYARAQPDPHAWLGKSACHEDAYYRTLLLADVSRDMRALLPQLSALMADMRSAAFTLDCDVLCDLKACVEQEVACTASTPVLRNKPEFAPLHERFKLLKATYGDLCKRREKILGMPSHEESLRYGRALCSLALRLDETYTEKKATKGKADYADLEHQALKILNGAHGAEIVSAYDYVFVDEYQDISPLQEEILKKFTGNMFFVGDVKQSVYGFRMCRPDFFQKKYKAYKAGAGEAAELTENFRSGRKILETVNRVFSSVMTDEFGGAEYARDACLSAGKDSDAQVKALWLEKEDEKEDFPEPCVYSLADDTGAFVDRASEAQTDAVLDEILAYLDETPDASFADVAVLVRSRGTFTDLLERKLRSASVPVCVLSSDTFADTFTSVSALVAFLRLLDNARDDVHLAAVLFSPLFGGYTGEEAADLRQKGDGTFYDCVFGGEANGKLLRLREAITHFRNRSVCLPVSELAGEITAYFDCFNGALKLGGEREAAALDAFLEHLAAQTDYESLHAYLLHIKRAGMPKLKVTGGGNAVRIMTVHASKGLEFPFVILPDLQKQFNMRDAYAGVLCDEEEGVVLRTYDFADRSVTENPRYAVCAKRVKRAVAEEELRILYVAMTRAQRKLTLLSTVPQQEKRKPCVGEDASGYIDWLYDATASFAERVSCRAYTPRYTVSSPPALRAPDAETVQKLTDRFERADAPVKTAGIVKASVSGLVRRPDEAFVPANAFPEDDRAAKEGSAYHKFMQWADFTRQNEWIRLCTRFPEEGTLVRKEPFERAVRQVGAFIAGREFYREKEFVVRLSGREIGMQEEDVLVQGVIDLLILSSDGGVEIVDYKTGSEANLYKPAYFRQLRLYKQAVEKVLRKKVTGTYLYGLSCGKFIRTDNEKAVF